MEKEGNGVFAEKARVLLILPQDILDRARVLAGKATTTLKLPVSVQIILRALIEEGLKRDGDRNLSTNIENQARAVRRIRRRAGRGGGARGDDGNLQPAPAKLSAGQWQGGTSGSTERSGDETNRS